MSLLKKELTENSGFVIEFSVKKEKGVDEFSNLIKKLFDMGNLDDISSGAVINIRHKEALFAASKSVKSAIDAINMGLPVDMTSVDIENAIASLGTVTGLTIGEEVVDRIFHEFCVGK